MDRAEVARRVRGHIRQKSFTKTAVRALKNLGTSYYLEVDTSVNDAERSARSFLGSRLTAHYNLQLVRFVAHQYEQISLSAEARQEQALSSTPDPRIRVYSYWNAGPDSAPPVSQLCFQRLSRVCGPNEVVLLDSSSIRAYIAPPEEQWFAGLSEQHKSDLYRLMLLHRYGGFWNDATCFLRERPHEAMRKLGSDIEFFAYSGRQRGEIQNFFLSAKSCHPALAVAIEAWIHVARHYEGLLPYFWFQITFKALYYLNDDVRSAWNLMPKIDLETPHALARVLYSGEPSIDWTSKYEYSFAHKLTNRSVLPQDAHEFLNSL